MKLSTYSSSLLIDLELKAKTKKTVLKSLIKLLKHSGQILSEEQVYQDLLRREEIASTGLTYGIAIPHCRTKGVSGLVIGFARSKEGVNFDALDGGKSHLFFIILAPQALSSKLLKIAGNISGRLRSEEARKRLYEARFPQEILDFLDGS